VLYRLTLVRHPDPAYFGRAPVNRFDAPDGSYGDCYLGTTLDCCVAELLLRVLARDEPAGTYLLHPDQLRQYYAAWVSLARPLRLAWLADDGLVHLGIDQRVTGGDN
jgi:hypothetical protein